METYTVRLNCQELDKCFIVTQSPDKEEIIKNLAPFWEEGKWCLYEVPLKPGQRYLFHDCWNGNKFYVVNENRQLQQVMELKKEKKDD